MSDQNNAIVMRAMQEANLVGWFAVRNDQVSVIVDGDAQDMALTLPVMGVSREIEASLQLPVRVSYSESLSPMEKEKIKSSYLQSDGEPVCQ
jgi:hypothetical protein